MRASGSHPLAADYRCLTTPASQIHLPPLRPRDRPAVSHSAENRAPEQAAAQQPPERTRDAGETLPVRVERRNGAGPQLEEVGEDSRCLARPVRLTERQTDI